jgi:hypothetical protein
MYHTGGREPVVGAKRVVRVLSLSLCSIQSSSGSMILQLPLVVGLLVGGRVWAGTALGCPRGGRRLRVSDR